MPSLRRTLSSPVVRSSPYPTLLSSSSSGPATRPGHGHRRSSGSETATRRVLADIEWWRVTDGQRDPEAEQDDHEQSPQSPAENLLDSLEGLVSPVWPGFSEYSELLTIVPQTPPRRAHRLESSTSSVESTPEAREGPVEGLRLSLQSVDLGSTDAVLPPAATSALPRSRSFASSSAMPHSDYPNFGAPSSLSPEFFN
ncbi:hypothetical protein BT96DRAFT_931662 [Gymnopus androsaceus JB14]|uniref:Uncharacterized protein n=1 Tax=Gymnopus androsaceus JB14 TaxID=1447944 RepID=A0A6A4IIG0_9AGAR|nr:hypothetical protein BT96DRAFT_931662 [Gymnopus androsaceus JB14]